MFYRNKKNTAILLTDLIKNRLSSRPLQSAKFFLCVCVCVYVSPATNQSPSTRTQWVASKVSFFSGYPTISSTRMMLIFSSSSFEL